MREKGDLFHEFELSGAITIKKEEGGRGKEKAGA